MLWCSIIGCLKRVETLRPPVVDRLVELSSPSVADPVSFGETAGPLWGTVTSTSGERLEGVTVSARAPGRNVTTSVFTDSDGEYHFPPLETGRPYKVWAWTLFENPVPNASNYGMTGDGAGNGRWSTAIPQDGLMKADLETGQATFVPLPEAVNDRSDLFTAEELGPGRWRSWSSGRGRSCSD